MAQKVRIVLVDDFDGGDADETVRFGLDGVQYEIDLSSDNANRLREIVRPYVLKARRTTGRVIRGRGGGSNSEKDRETARIRSWAKDNGYAVNERGRISAQLKQSYREATQS